MVQPRKGADGTLYDLRAGVAIDLSEKLRGEIRGRLSHRANMTRPPLATAKHADA